MVRKVFGHLWAEARKNLRVAQLAALRTSSEKLSDLKLEIGDRVWLHDPVLASCKLRKVSLLYKGPYTILLIQDPKVTIRLTARPTAQEFTIHARHLARVNTEVPEDACVHPDRRTRRIQKLEKQQWDAEEPRRDVPPRDLEQVRQGHSPLGETETIKEPVWGHLKGQAAKDMKLLEKTKRAEHKVQREADLVQMRKDKAQKEQDKVQTLRAKLLQHREELAKAKGITLRSSTRKSSSPERYGVNLTTTEEPTTFCSDQVTTKGGAPISDAKSDDDEVRQRTVSAKGGASKMPLNHLTKTIRRPPTVIFRENGPKTTRLSFKDDQPGRDLEDTWEHVSNEEIELWLDKLSIAQLKTLVSSGAYRLRLTQEINQ
jgi:hypothetical protein